MTILSLRKRPRRGATLIELSIVIAAMSIIMSAMAVTLHRMYRADRSVRDEVAESASVTRLALTVRADAHAARAVEELTDTRLQLRMADSETIEYTVADDLVRRVKRRGDELVHHDSFRLPSGASVEFVHANEGAAATVSILITRAPGGATGAMSTQRIDAAVGLDDRYLALEE